MFYCAKELPSIITLSQRFIQPVMLFVRFRRRRLNSKVEVVMFFHPRLYCYIINEFMQSFKTLAQHALKLRLLVD